MKSLMESRAYRPKGQPEPVRVHDFVIPELGRAAPYGVYDIADNVGWVRWTPSRSADTISTANGTIPSARRHQFDAMVHERALRVTPQRPHGISYSLVLRPKAGGAPWVRFDNAHAVQYRGKVHKCIVYDHWHRSTHDEGRPYGFTTVTQLRAGSERALIKAAAAAEFTRLLAEMNAQNVKWLKVLRADKPTSRQAGQDTAVQR